MVNYSYFSHLDNKCGQASAPASHMKVSGPEGGSNQVLFAEQSQQGWRACHSKILFNYDFVKEETEIHGDKRAKKEH